MIFSYKILKSSGFTLVYIVFIPLKPKLTRKGKTHSFLDEKIAVLCKSQPSFQKVLWQVLSLKYLGGVNKHKHFSDLHWNNVLFVHIEHSSHASLISVYQSLKFYYITQTTHRDCCGMPQTQEKTTQGNNPKRIM